MVRILRAATWNFGYGSVGSPSKNNKTKVQKALEYLRKNNVDIVLAQEIFDPNELRRLYPNQIYSDVPVYNPQGQGLWGAMDFSIDTRNNNSRPKWGTAILAAENVNLSKIELKYSTAYPGSMTVAQIAGTDIAVISMYGKNVYDYEKVTAFSYLANLHRCLSDTAPLLDGFSSAKRFIIAGVGMPGRNGIRESRARILTFLSGWQPLILRIVWGIFLTAVMKRHLNITAIDK